MSIPLTSIFQETPGPLRAGSFLERSGDDCIYFLSRTTGKNVIAASLDGDIPLNDDVAVVNVLNIGRSEAKEILGSVLGKWTLLTKEEAVEKIKRMPSYHGHRNEPGWNG